MRQAVFLLALLGLFQVSSVGYATEEQDQPALMVKHQTAESLLNWTYVVLAKLKQERESSIIEIKKVAEKCVNAFPTARSPEGEPQENRPPTVNECVSASMKWILSHDESTDIDPNATFKLSECPGEQEEKKAVQGAIEDLLADDIQQELHGQYQCASHFVKAFKILAELNEGIQYESRGLFWRSLRMEFGKYDLFYRSLTRIYEQFLDCERDYMFRAFHCLKTPEKKTEYDSIQNAWKEHRGTVYKSLQEVLSYKTMIMFYEFYLTGWRPSDITYWLVKQGFAKDPKVDVSRAQQDTLLEFGKTMERLYDYEQLTKGLGHVALVSQRDIFAACSGFAKILKMDITSNWQALQGLLQNEAYNESVKEPVMKIEVPQYKSEEAFLVNLSGILAGFDGTMEKYIALYEQNKASLSEMACGAIESALKNYSACRSNLMKYRGVMTFLQHSNQYEGTRMVPKETVTELAKGLGKDVGPLVRTLATHFYFIELIKKTEME